MTEGAGGVADGTVRVCGLGVDVFLLAESDLLGFKPLRSPHWARLSYADDSPGCKENGFNPPRPKGVYNKLGLGKRNGKAHVVGILDDDEGCDADEETGGLLIRSSIFRDLFFIVFGLLFISLSRFIDGNPNPAKLLNNEFVKFKFDILLRFPTFPKPLIPLKAPKLGTPPNGSKRGFLGSKPPNAPSPVRRFGFRPDNPPKPAVAKGPSPDVNGRLDANDDERPA